MTITTFQWEKIRDWEWLVEEEEVPNVPQTELPEFPMIRQGGQWDNPTDISQLFLPLQVYSFINKDGEYGYYEDGIFKSITSSYPTEEQFKEYGLSDIGVIEGEILEDLLKAKNIQVVSYLEDDLINNLAVYGELNGQFTHLKQPRKTKDVERLVIADNSEGAKYIFSDDKEKWYVLSPENQWQQITWKKPEELESKAMSKNRIRDIRSSTWDELGEKIYVGIYLPNIEAGVKTIDGQKLLPIDTPRIRDAKLYILNTKATINLQFKSNTLFGSLTDDDTGKVQYKVILNGENLVPEDDEFTELSPSPENINIPIPKDKIKQGETNTIEVQFQDAWGSMDTWSATFIGREFGILFMDEDEDLYSDAKGNILKPLELGGVIIGEPTDSQAIKLKNDTELDLENVIIQSVLSEEIDGATFLFSLDSEGEYTKQLTLPKLDLDEVITFYVKLDTVLDVTPEIKSNALFTVKATGVNPTL